ncbi:MAG TPA: alpha/beta hydrolase [Candidatus Paceibacterota bacterium]|nr:alpha/beta hydrolase [Candidatus Paceibacterota bacterium]
MKWKTLFVSALLTATAVCVRSEVQEKSAPSQPASPAAPAPMPSSLVIEKGGSGPYKAVAVGDASLPGFAIYRPQDLSAFGNDKMLPVVLWGNGAGANNSAGYKNFLNEIASQGFIVIAIGPYELLVSKNQELERKRTSAAQFLEALDWITAQNKSVGSVYNGKIDVAKVAVMGHSLGGLQAIEISNDPRVTATALCNSGIIKGTPPNGMPIMPGVKKELLDQLHAPILYLMGGKSDMAWDNGADDYARISKVPAVLASQEVGHGGTYGAPHGGTFGVAAVAWLKWQLKGDKDAAAMFTGGEQCGLCKGDSKWKVEVKNLNNQ